MSLGKRRMGKCRVTATQHTFYHLLGSGHKRIK
jgi:hypothetical protein